jgi:DNA-binding NtrC family response regulator
MSPQKKLLIVDDEEAALVGMRRYFEANHYSVDCAREREEAEALLAHRQYDCVIADLCLTPAYGPDGLDLVAQARALCPHTRIVVLTALSSSDTVVEAERVGAAVFLRKPQPLAEIARIVEKLLGSDK